MIKRNLLERLEEDTVICAEGFLFEAERRGYLASGEFVPELALEQPEALKNIHIDFQHAGADVVEALHTMVIVKRCVLSTKKIY